MEGRVHQETTFASGFTAVRIRIRQATDADMPFIEAELIRNNIDTENLDYHEFVVAAQNGEIAGFGRLRNTGEFYQLGCVAVVEEHRGRGVSSLIIKHLLDYSPVNLVYIVTELVDYFEKLGFVEMKEGSKELLDALDEACKVIGKPNTVIMVYENPVA